MSPQIPVPFTMIGPVSIRSFTLLLTLAIALTLATTLFSQRHQLAPAAIIEAGIVALLLGIAGARLGHVLLHWDYFVEHQSEILQLRQGGLNWHGALLGAWLGLRGCRVAARWREIDGPRLAGALSFAIPIFALAAWRACISALCAYGREIETLYGRPAWLADWAADIFTRIAPRYNTASLGALLACGMFTVACTLSWRNVSAPRRLAIQLAILAAGMWCIGGLRGDPVTIFAGQRADQWLDLIVLLAAIITFLRSPVPSSPSSFASHLPKNEDPTWQVTT